MPPRDVHVHLVPKFAEADRLRGSIAIAIDVLRATTTIVHALAAGCVSVRPCAEIDEAKSLARGFPSGHALLAGERGGLTVAGFDLGNSPRECTPARLYDKTLIFTTSNGTRAILAAAAADRVLIASFVNFSAVCEQLLSDARPIHIVCAGDDGQPCLEDTMLAGAFVEVLSEKTDIRPNDSARLAWDCFENHGQIVLGALEVSSGGERLTQIGCAADLPIAAEVDRFTLVPELRRDPLRIEVAAAGIVKRHWPR